MSLTERDESDLVVLASNVGSPEAEGRARQLIETNAEAAVYYRQVRSLRDALEVQSDMGWPPLPEEETNALTTVILERSERRRSLRNRVRRHPRRWAGVAAAMVLLAAGLSLYLWHDRSPVASATYIPGARLAARGAEKRFDVPVKAGELVAGEDGYTVLDLYNGGRLAMQAFTKLTIGKDGQDINLQTGSVFIQASRPTHVQAGMAAISLDEPSSKAIIEYTPSTVRCLVQSGRVMLVVGGHETVLAAGQMVSLDLPSGKALVQPLDNRGTGWVGEAFKAAIRDT